MGCMVPKYGISPCCGSLAVHQGWTDGKAAGMKKPNSAKLLCQTVDTSLPLTQQKDVFQSFCPPHIHRYCVDTCPIELTPFICCVTIRRKLHRKKQRKSSFLHDQARHFQEILVLFIFNKKWQNSKIWEEGKILLQVFFQTFFRHFSYILFIHTSDIFRPFSVKLKVLLYNANHQFFTKKCTSKILEQQTK